MFIRKTFKIDKNTKKKYYSYQLVESIRTIHGPRQKTLLTIKRNIELSKQERKLLASRIEEITAGIQRIIPLPEKIESLAELFASQLIKKQSEIVLTDHTQQINRDYKSVDLNTIKHEKARSAGLEYICLETIRKLGIDEKLKELGFTERQVESTVAVIIGKLAGCVSEKATYDWLKNTTGLDELLKTDFSRLSPKSIYNVGDLLLKHKSAIEDHLTTKEKNLFSFKNTVILYDLTNSYFEGSAKGVFKAAKGRSKERRADCPLITLGLVMNSYGFPLRSDIFEGNVSEPKTLKIILDHLDKDLGEETIVVLDAGIATEENLKWLRERNYPYIVCSKRHIQEMPDDICYEVVKKSKDDIVVEAAPVVNSTNDEIKVYCRSQSKKKQDLQWKSQVQERFEGALQKLLMGLKKPRCMKDYVKVVEKIGRLKGQYSRISQYYEINVEKDSSSNKAVNITWKRNDDAIEERFNGVYCLRVYGLQWETQRLWDTYIMLTKVEESFKCLKLELGLRPIFHQTSKRVDGHFFITLLSYHVLQTILYQLSQRGIRLRWGTLIRNMSTQVLITTVMRTKGEDCIRVRGLTEAEFFHRKIYDALNLKLNSFQLNVSSF